MSKINEAIDRGIRYINDNRYVSDAVRNALLLMLDAMKEGEDTYCCNCHKTMTYEDSFSHNCKTTVRRDTKKDTIRALYEKWKDIQVPYDCKTTYISKMYEYDKVLKQYCEGE